MSTATPVYQIYPLGDSALTLAWEPVMDPQRHRQLMARQEQLRQANLPGVTEWAPAYHTLTLFYDPLQVMRCCADGQTAFDWLREQLMSLLAEETEPRPAAGRTLRIPVCYDPSLGPDLAGLAEEKKCSPEELVRRHTEVSYHVYMLGFLPGFAYMGELPPELETTRKAKPVRVRAGSVGLAGKQTGIYPLDAPGGWQIIGRTPWSLFDPRREEPCLLRPGDEVQFFSISLEDYYNAYRTP